MSNIKNHINHYTYSVSYSSEDEAYLAECLELGIVADGETQEEAITAIKEAARIHVLMLKENGDEIP